MGKVIIELADSIEFKIKAKNLTEAIEKLIKMRNEKTCDPILILQNSGG